MGALLAGTLTLPAAAEFTTPPDEAGTVVGMAWDDRTDRLWLAGQEADSGSLLGLTEDGDGSSISFGGEVESVQALAIHEGALYVGDIGDEDESRDSILVLRFENTDPGQKQYRGYSMAYPDGESHHSEAMMVSGRGNLYFVTQGDDPGIYLYNGEPSRTEVNELRRVADAPAGVTDGVFLEDGSTMALRAEDGVHIVDGFSFETQAVETYVNPPEDHAIATRSDQLLFAGVGAIREAAVPTSDITTEHEPPESESPSPSPSAVETEGEQPTEPTAEASPSAPEAAPEEEAARNTPTNTRTIVALVIAGVVAVAAGVATFVVRN